MGLWDLSRDDWIPVLAKIFSINSLTDCLIVVWRVQWGLLYVPNSMLIVWERLTQNYNLGHSAMFVGPIIAFPLWDDILQWLLPCCWVQEKLSLFLVKWSWVTRTCVFSYCHDVQCYSSIGALTWMVTLGPLGFSCAMDLVEHLEYNVLSFLSKSL